MCSVIVFDHIPSIQSPPPKHIEIISPQTLPPIQVATNISSSGQGTLLNFKEWAWGTQTQTNINEDTILQWETPGNWIGHELTVTVSNLQEIISSELSPITAWDYARYTSVNPSGGIWQNTQDYGANWFNWTLYLLIQKFNFSLTFRTDAVISTVTQIEVTTYADKDNQMAVDIYLHNFATGSNLNIGSLQNGIKWTNVTGGDSNYVSADGDIMVLFNGSINNLNRKCNFDYVGVEVTASRRWVNPRDTGVDLEIYDNQTYYNIYDDPSPSKGDGFRTIFGTWKDYPKEFSFRANSSINLEFDISHTFWISQNKTNSVSTTYYLNQSVFNPSTHLWNLTFNQDALPGGGYTALNFTIYPVAFDWVLKNASDPSGTPQLLTKNSSEIRADENLTFAGGGTWMIFCYSPNYITSVQLSQNDTILITDNLDINVNFLENVTNGNTNLTVSVESNSIFDAIQNTYPLQSFNWNISGTTTKNGTYVITTSYFNNTELGVYSTSITIIYPTNLSIISPDVQYLEFFKADVLNLTVFYENLFYPNNYYNERGTNGSHVSWEITNTTGYKATGTLSDQLEGFYYAPIDTAVLPIFDGNYNLTVIANKSTYVNQSRTILIRCFERSHYTNATLIIPSMVENLVWLGGMNYSLWVFNNQSFTLYFNYTDIYKSPVLVDNANVTVYLFNATWQTPLGYPIHGYRYLTGYYHVNISNIGLRPGQYTLLINLSKNFYENSSIWIQYTIRNLDATIRVSKYFGSTNLTTYYEWEFLDFSIKVEYNTTNYYEFTSWDTPIDWAVVRYYLVPLNGDPLNPMDIIKSGLIDINASGFFELQNVPLTNASENLKPGTYEFYIHANASDCEDIWYDFNLTVLKRLNTTLKINNPGSFKIDKPISLSVTLDSDELAQKWYLYGKMIYFNVTIYFNPLNPQSFVISDTVDQLGELDLTIDLGNYVTENLSHVTGIEIHAYFEGFEAYYPDISFYKSNDVYLRLNIHTPFNYMFIIFIIIGVALTLVALIVIHRKVVVPAGVQKSKSINYLFTSFRDIVGLQNLFVILKSTGDLVLSKTYSPEGIDDSMQNVLVNVIHSYGTGDQRHDAFCDLVRFEDFMILLDDGDYIRTAVTVSEIPSDKLIRSLVRFVQFFELQNYALLKDAKGPIQDLQGIDELLDIQFGASVIAPYTINKIKKLAGFEETLMLMAMSLMEDHNYFYLAQLYARAKGETLIEEMMIFKTIQDLIDKKVIIPYIPTKKGSPAISKELVVKTEFSRLKSELINAKNKAMKAYNTGKFDEAEDYYRAAASFAAQIGDFETKDKLLKKSREALVKAESQKYTLIEEAEYEVPVSDIEEILEAPPSIEEIEMLPSKQPAMPPSVEAPIQSSQDLLEDTFVTPATIEPPITEAEDELTPLEKALAVTKALDLMAEDEPVISKPSTAAEPPTLIQEETSSTIEEISPPLKEIPLPIEADQTIRSQAEALPSHVRPPPVEHPRPLIKKITEEIPPPIGLSDKETKILTKLLKLSQTTLNDIQINLNKISNIVQDLVHENRQLKDTTKETFKDVVTKTKGLMRHLLRPKKDIAEEIQMVESKLPTIVTQIDAIDLQAVKIKKELTETQKMCKNLLDNLDQTESNILTIESYLVKTPPDLMAKEKENLNKIKVMYNDITNKLDDLTEAISNTHQEIVTLMIEDIEQLMAEEQKVEAAKKEALKKVTDTNRVKEAFLKENSKLNDDINELEDIIKVTRHVYNDLLNEKKIIASEVQTVKKETIKKIRAIQTTLKEQTIDFSSLFADIQLSKHGIDQLMQKILMYQEKIETLLIDLDRGEKIIVRLNKRKNNINKVIEKTTKYIFPYIIEEEHYFLVELDRKLNDFTKQGQTIHLELQSEIKTLQRKLIPSLKTLPKQLQQLESEVLKISAEMKNLETQRFFQDLNENLREPTPTKPEEPEAIDEDELSDNKLGIKQHCPYCRAIISENILNLIRKNYAPECPNCGEVIKPSDIELD